MTWEPKPYRPQTPPSREALDKVEKWLQSGDWTQETCNQIAGLMSRPPTQRMSDGVRHVIDMLESGQERAGEICYLLNASEYAVYVEVANSTASTSVKSAVEGLLCVMDRYIVSRFLHQTYRILRAHTATKQRAQQ